MSAGASKIWALRMPGGPTRVIKSERILTEDQAKKVYMESFKFVSTEVKRDTVWPLVKTLDEHTVKEYDSFMQLSGVTGKPRALVEV